MSKDKYIVEMRNPRNGRVERYTTATDNQDAIDHALSFFTEQGFEVLSCEKVVG